MQNDIDILITDYLTESISSVDKQELFAWLSKNEQNKKYFAQMLDIWNTSESINNKSKYNAEKSWEKFSLKIQSNKPKTKVISILYKISALFILCFGLWFAVEYDMKTTDNNYY